VAAASSVMLAVSGANQTFVIFFKPLLAEFGWTRASTAGAQSIRNILYGTLVVVTGRLNDRFGARLITTTAACFLGLGYFLMSHLQNSLQLYLYYGVLIAIGSSGDMVPLISTITRWFVKKRGLMTGIVLSANGLSQTIMPLVVSRLVVTYDWRQSYIIVALIAFIPTVIAAQFLRRDPAKMGQQPYGSTEGTAGGITMQSRGLSFQEALHTWQLWLLCIVVATSSFGVGVIQVHIVVHATDLGLPVLTGANILAFIGGLGIAGRIVMGTAADRIAPKLALIIACVLQAGATFFVIYAKDEWSLYLFGAIFGFGFGGFLPVHSLIVADLFGLGSHGVIYGLTMMSVTTGLGIGSYLAGKIFDVTGSYGLAFLISGIAMVVGLIAACLLKPIAKKEEVGT
jgi:MFS family permease